MDKQIIFYYQRGIASYLIAKKFNVSNSYVRSVLSKNNIKIRGHQLTNKMSARRRSPEQNKKITAAASESNRGSTHTALHRQKLALRRQKNPNIDPVYEKPLVELCKKLNIKIIPQKAFYKYNVDLYFVEENVVVEIFGGGFHNKEDAVNMFNNKMKYLSSKNIPVLIVWSDKLTFSPENIIKSVKEIKKPLTIINGDGSETTRGLNLIFDN